jgi:hypothetical protein
VPLPWAIPPTSGVAALISVSLIIYGVKNCKILKTTATISTIFKPSKVQKYVTLITYGNLTLPTLMGEKT